MESFVDKKMNKFKLTEEQIKRIHNNIIEHQRKELKMNSKKSTKGSFVDKTIHRKLTKEDIKKINDDIIENQRKELKMHRENKRKYEDLKINNEENRQLKRKKLLNTPEKITKCKKMNEDFINLQKTWRIADIEKSKTIFKNQIFEHPTAESLFELYTNDGDSLWNLEYYIPGIGKYHSLLVFNFIKNGYKYSIHIHNEGLMFTSNEKLKTLLDCSCWSVQFFIQKCELIII